MADPEIRKNEELQPELNEEDVSEEELTKLSGGRIIEGCVGEPLLKTPDDPQTYGQCTVIP